jgi:hypothetical protein
VTDPDPKADLLAAERKKWENAFLYYWRVLEGPGWWHPQVVLAPPPAPQFLYDFVEKQALVTVEINGAQWVKGGHNTGQGLERDARKNNFAQALGYSAWTFVPSMLSEDTVEANLLPLIAHVAARRAALGLEAAPARVRAPKRGPGVF